MLLVRIQSSLFNFYTRLTAYICLISSGGNGFTKFGKSHGQKQQEHVFLKRNFPFYSVVDHTLKE